MELFDMAYVPIANQLDVKSKDIIWVTIHTITRMLHCITMVCVSSLTGNRVSQISIRE
jgi:hypothetical protein